MCLFMLLFVGCLIVVSWFWAGCFMFGIVLFAGFVCSLLLACLLG